MGVFENFREVDGKVVDTSFIQWMHVSIPNSPNLVRWLMRIWAMLFGHCLRCIALSGCYFAKYNMPGDINNTYGLLHLHCHCYIENVSNSTLFTMLIRFVQLKNLQNIFLLINTLTMANEIYLKCLASILKTLMN